MVVDEVLGELHVLLKVLGRRVGGEVVVFGQSGQVGWWDLAGDVGHHFVGVVV